MHDRRADANIPGAASPTWGSGDGPDPSRAEGLADLTAMFASPRAWAAGGDCDLWGDMSHSAPRSE